MARLLHLLRAPENKGAERAAQALAEAHCHHITVLTHLFRVASIICGRISDPGPIHQYFHSLLLGITLQRRQSLERPNLASKGRVLNENKGGIRESDVLRLLSHSFLNYITHCLLLSSVNTPESSRICLVWTPQIEAMPALYLWMVCELPHTITSSPGRVRSSTEIRLAIVVEGTIMDASNPKNSAAICWNLLAVGSSQKTSSPTSAPHMAYSISCGGTLITSLLKSMQSLGLGASDWLYISIIQFHKLEHKCESINENAYFYVHILDILSNQLLTFIKEVIQIFPQLIFYKKRQDYMGDEILKYLNLAREYPGYFIPLIQKQIGSFVNEREMPLTDGVLYETNEGKSVWIEARNFLMVQKSLPPFSKHQGLTKSASDHKSDLCLNGIFGHRGSDGSSFSERILRHCKKGPGAMAEIIGADFDIKDRNTAEMTILSLIIDDGVKDRGHRKTIFSPTYRFVGWSSGKQEEKFVTVINLTENNLETLFGGNNENSFCGVTEKPSSSQRGGLNSGRHFSMGWDQPVKDITNQLSATTPEWKSNDFVLTKGSSLNNGGESSRFGMRKGKKVTEKRENTRTFFEEGAKIIETTIKLIYNDGSVQENTDRRTLYIDQ